MKSKLVKVTQPVTFNVNGQHLERLEMAMSLKAKLSEVLADYYTFRD